ncbi:MAG: hypothetical protein ACMUJM_16650 [bacterium]
MKEKAIYISESTFKSLWQEYRIYEDHLEFVTHVGLITIPFDQIEKIEVQESDVKNPEKFKKVLEAALRNNKFKK